MKTAAVFGTGSWGTTFALVLAEAGQQTVLWGRREEIVSAINSGDGNQEYLPGIELPASLRATTDAAEALDGTDLVVLAVPSHSLRKNLTQWASLVPAHAVLLSLMKGIEQGTCKRMSEVICEVAGVPAERVGVASGPNLALEIAQRQPAATVVACVDPDTAERVQHACHTAWFRPYTNTDVVGVELGGAVKNVIALAVGVSVGMGLGDNAKAALMTRGLAEISRLGAALGADQHTFAGLAGLGDLIATCSSPLSRNRTFGENLGRGMTLDEVISVTKQTAEGVRSSQSILALAGGHGVDMPITEAVVKILYEGLKAQEAMVQLLSRSAKPERYGV